MNTYRAIFPSSQGIWLNSVLKIFCVIEIWNRCRKEKRALLTEVKEIAIASSLK